MSEIRKFNEWSDKLSNACSSGNVYDIKLLLVDGRRNFQEAFKKVFKDEPEYVKFEDLLASYIIGPVCKNTKVITLLLENGANPNEAMFQVCYNGSRDSVMELVLYGANNWSRGLYGACYGNQPEIADMMLCFGASDSKNVINSALKTACEQGHMPIIKLLVDEWGANDWSQGFLAACSYAKLEIAEFMLNKAVDNNCEIDWTAAFDKLNEHRKRLVKEREHYDAMKYRLLELRDTKFFSAYEISYYYQHNDAEAASQCGFVKIEHGAEKIKVE
jgi:hypothetical protein